MNLFRKSLAALLGCALFTTTALVADAGLVSQAAVVLFAGAASVGAIADESPRFVKVEEIVKPQRVLQENTPTPSGVTMAPTAGPSMAPGAPTNGGAGMFVGGASKAAMSFALAALAGGAMAAAV